MLFYQDGWDITLGYEGLKVLMPVFRLLALDSIDQITPTPQAYALVYD